MGTSLTALCLFMTNIGRIALAVNEGFLVSFPDGVEVELVVVNMVTGGDQVNLKQAARATCVVTEGNPSPATVSWIIDFETRPDVGTTYDFTPPNFATVRLVCQADNGFYADAEKVVGR